MIGRWALIGLLSVSSSAFAWQDVSKTATLPSGAVYCTSQGNLEDFAAFALDGDEAGATRLVSQGKCTVLRSNMSVAVFQENDDFANFLSPSGKALYTLKGYLR